MEIRKVQITGGSSNVISLPKEWIKSQNIKKNDPLGIIIHSNGNLIITKKIEVDQTQITKEFAIDDIKEPVHLFRYLISAYITGYNIIKIKSRDKIPPFVTELVRKYTQSTIGQEVVEETPQSITIKDLLNPSEMPFDNTIKRMFVITKSMHEDAIDALKNKDVALAESIILRDNDPERLHWLIARQHSIVLRDQRLVEKMKVSTNRITNYLLISRIIERISDHAVIIAKNSINLKDEKIDERIIDAIVSNSKFALGIFEESIEAFFRRDLKSSNQNIEQVKKLISMCEESNKMIQAQKIRRAISIGNIIESIRRTGEYSGDISEHLFSCFD